jgi:biotin carboxyl carrier protein
VGAVWRWRQRPFQQEPPRAKFNHWAAETFQIGSERVTVHYQQADERTLTVRIEAETLEVVLLREATDSIVLRINSWQQRYHLTPEGTRLHVHALNLGNQVIERHTRFQRAAQADQGGSYRASMPGRVVRVLVEVGTAVTQGQKLLVMESMKMENSITAAANGIVTHLYVAEGDLVEADTQLISVEEKC